MKLLCLKTGDKYLKINNTTFELTSISKASVYSILQKDDVKDYYNKFKSNFTDLSIKQLTISEEAFNEN